MFDIESLRIIWWLLLGILLTGFAVLDGFDFGVACLLPVVARNELERQVVLNTIRPFWEGNQVWIILGAGAIFAAWPYVYAAAFSGTYFIMLLLLLTMGISRPVSFKYREKLANLFWRRFWDHIVFVGGFFPALIFGILMGNVLIGLPFYFDDQLRIFYEGSFTDFFHPFALLCGLTSLTMLVAHGGLYLAIKTEGQIRMRALRWTRLSALIFILFFAMSGLWVSQFVLGFQVVGQIDHAGFSNPLRKSVIQFVGAWLTNYTLYPLFLLVPITAFLSALGVILAASLGNSRFAFCLSSLVIACVIGTLGISMFPFILPSNVHPASSLLIWDASSSRLTLLMMLAAVVVFMPIILFYTAWVYRALRGKVREEDQEEHLIGNKSGGR